MAMQSPTERQAFDDVEIRIFRQKGGEAPGYDVQITLPGGGRETSPRDVLPMEALQNAHVPRPYGELLSAWLFHGRIEEAFRQARGLAEAPTRSLNVGVGSRTGLRLRLWLDPEAPELDDLRWETLIDPADGGWLAITTAFSRFVRTSSPWGSPVWDRPLRMLLIVSDPEVFATMAEDIEKTIVRQATRPLGQFLEVVRLAGPPTIERLRYAEKDGYHITHLSARTASHDGRDYLVLVDDNGQPTEESCEIVAQAITAGATSSAQPPSLVFLATPIGALEQDTNILSGLGELLIDRGVQAVVAIRGPMEEHELFVFAERFYGVLIQTGVIDVALATARADILSDGWAWTHPVLYIRTFDAQLFQPLTDQMEATVKSVGDAAASIGSWGM